VHMKYRGTPILGDPVYGSISINKKYGLERQLLHAHELKFIHPITQQPIHLTAPLPEHFKALLKRVHLNDLNPTLQ
jgi:23S rRNA pseudouridine1911/1915/1917 synthase